MAAAILALAVVENAGVMSMVTVSEAYAKASAAERLQLETVRGRRRFGSQLGALHGAND